MPGGPWMNDLIRFVIEVLQALYWLIILRWAVSVFRPQRPPRWFVTLEWWAERLTEWLLGPVRRVLPATGALDLAPVVAIIGLWIVQQVLSLFLVA